MSGEDIFFDILSKSFVGLIVLILSPILIPAAIGYGLFKMCVVIFK